MKQKNGAGFDTLETRTNNSLHEPLTVTDAAGQTSTYTYNAAGQVATVTNAKSETTTYAYTPSGSLQSITGALPGATTTFGYDAFGRISTVTDSEGYAVTTTFDAASRPTTEKNLTLIGVRPRSGPGSDPTRTAESGFG